MKKVVAGNLFSIDIYTFRGDRQTNKSKSPTVFKISSQVLQCTHKVL